MKVKARHRTKRLAKLRTAAKKLDRNKRKFEKLQQDTLTAKKERLTRAGKYKRGMNLDITMEEEGALSVRKVKPPSVCPHPFCGLIGHKTTKAKACKANPKRLELEGTAEACAVAIARAAGAPAPAAVVGVVNADALDLTRHEEVPLDDSSIDMYEEANTWSEDEDGNVV